MKKEKKIEDWEKFPPDKRSKYWNDLVDVLEAEFPKGKCKERGQALVLLAYAEMALQKAEKEKEKLLGKFKKRLVKIVDVKNK